MRHTFAAVRQNRRLVPAGTAPGSAAIFGTKVIRTAGLTTMTKELIERSRRRHAFADVPLIVLTATLVLSLAVAFNVIVAGAVNVAPFAGAVSVTVGD